MRAAVERLVGAGATVLQLKEEAGSFVAAMQDPEGNEFDIV